MALWNGTLIEAAAVAALGTVQPAAEQPPVSVAGNSVLVDLSVPTASPSPSTPDQIVSGNEARREADGLFYLNALVNGVIVRFLVDTGASMIVLTAADARRTGVMPPPASFVHAAETAAGRTAMARVKITSLAVGGVRRSAMDAAVTDAGLGVSLLGQSWLSRFSAVSITGDRMIFHPADSGAPWFTRLTAILPGKGWVELDPALAPRRSRPNEKRPRIAPEPPFYLRG